MRKINLIIIAVVLLAACSSSQESSTGFKDLNGNGTLEPYENEELTTEERVADLLTRMTVEDKVNLAVGVGMNLPGVSEAERADKVLGAAGATYSFDSLGIPSMILADGPAGLRITPVRDSASDKRYFATAFPIASLIAATWDKELAQKVGAAMGHEVKEYGVDVLLAPALNIHRNPLAGRNFEYYSEDPLLSGSMAAAVVKGVQSNGVGTSIKHYAANNEEWNRMKLNAIVSERALREIYLRGFEIAIKEAEPWSVMSAYNKVNGQFASQNKDLLTTVLRDDWGYDGFVMTDWFAGKDAVAQMKAGNDLLMPGTPQQKEVILKAVENGSLPESVLDKNTSRILKILFKSPVFNDYDYSDAPDLKANAEISRQAATQGIVLLENNNGALPLDNSITAAALGVGSYDFIAGGTGSGDVNEAYTVSLVEGMENASLKYDQEIKGEYESYIKEEKAKQPKKEFFFALSPPIPEMPVSKDKLEELATNNDMALLTISRNSGEFQDRTQEGDYYLTKAELDLIKKTSEVFHAAGKKVVVVLNIGNVIEMMSWKDQVDAIVLAWQGGQEAGNALVDVLLSKVNPSGKLPTTFTKTYDDVSSAKNYPGELLPGAEEEKMGGFSRGADSEVVYEEGVYVGYRYYNTFNREVAYPFGYGLSYTTFEYGELTLSSTAFGDKIEATISITNTGDVAGKEVVQLYISAPGESMDKPALELRDYAKTNVLKPGESQELKFEITPRMLTSFDTQRDMWVAEPGEYSAKAGASSMDVKSTKIFTLDAEMVVEEVNNALTPTRDIDEIEAP